MLVIESFPPWIPDRIIGQHTAAQHSISNTGNFDGNTNFMITDGPTPPSSPLDSDTEAISLAFLISLSVTFAILMILLVVVAAYVTFCGYDESDYDEEVANNNSSAAPGRGRNLNRPFNMLFNKMHSSILLDSTFTNPGEYDDAAALDEREIEEFKKMSIFEIELYKRAKALQAMAPPNTDEFGSYLKTSDITFIKDRGIQSFFFLPSINDNIDKSGQFLPSFIVQDKLDVYFTKFNRSSSTVMNYPLPYNKKDAVYFEVKVYKHENDSNSIFSIGLSTVPYPYFRPPGMSQFSIAYESTGKLRINNPFVASTLLPKLEEGDIVGLGFKYKTGTLFITHNGKKVMDVTQNVDVDLFPCIGCFNASYTRTYTKDGLLEDPDNVDLREALSQGRQIELPDKLMRVHDAETEKDNIESDEVELQVNLGQIGFVFIEANVKKYSFGKVYGDIGIPPTYNGTEIKKDAILQKGEDMPPAYIDGSTDLIGQSSHEQAVSGHLHGNIVTVGTPTDPYESISSNFDRQHNMLESNGVHLDSTLEETYQDGRFTNVDEEETLLPSTAYSEGMTNTEGITADESSDLKKSKKSKKRGKKNKKKSKSRR